ncbi:hypothetical protein M408DRAFT_77961 [Serendipita vermifera MAFF 305830]|uniref:Uncharacterized protein n=1 Tax=Serendipita vermifera MAFF 305830 TaxID=933852 RepID=A0A0C3AET8_SERVB|nr:hypothetical protein M408DRAFT_77961 [Serendipita vermifera MAFF 305830]
MVSLHYIHLSTVIENTNRHTVLENLALTVCECQPAPDQLLAQGLFPCSPLRPSVAADTNLLELIITSFLYLTLNSTG